MFLNFIHSWLDLLDIDFMFVYLFYEIVILLLSVMKELEVFLALDIHLLDMLWVFSEVLPEIFDLSLEIRCVIISISWILKENDVVLGLD